MPMIRTDLSLSYTQVGIVISAFAITSGISQLPGGWLADRLGVRAIVMIGVSGMSVGGLMIGFSQSYVGLIIFLVFAAALGGGYHPASVATISASVPPERRGWALGLHSIGGSASFWVVPLLAAPIAVAWGWRSSYIMLTIPTILLGIALFILIGKRKQSRSSTESQMIGTEVTDTPVRIRWRQLLPFLVMSVTTVTIIQSIVAYLSLYAVDDLGVTESTAAMLVAIMPAVGFFAAPLGGFLSDRFGGIRVLVTISLLSIPLIYLLGVASNVPALVIVLVAIGIVAFIRKPTSEAYIFGHTPKGRRSTILGLYFFGGMAASGLLTPIMGNLIDRFGFQKSFTIASAVQAVVTVVCSLFLWKDKS